MRKLPIGVLQRFTDLPETAKLHKRDRREIMAALGDAPVPKGVYRVLPSLVRLLLPVRALHLDPANTRAHSDKNLATIAASLQRFRQRKPIVVQREGMLVRAGNGTLQAAQQLLGWTHVAAVVVDESDVAATAYSIADNRSSDLSDWDYEALSKTIQAMDVIDRALLYGWEDYELEPLLAAEWKPPEIEDLDDHVVRTKHVSFTPEEYERLQKAVAAIRVFEGTPKMSEAEAVLYVCAFWTEAADE